MDAGGPVHGNRGRMLVAALLICLFVALLTAGYLQRVHSCYYANQLATNPTVFAGYLVEISAGRRGDGTSGSVDNLSWECLVCHDGIVAPTAHYRISDGTLSKQARSIVTIVGPHPIGMGYVKATAGRNFAPVGELPTDMVLMYGNVGCVTCHNLLGNYSSHLVVNNDFSRLCFICHRI